MLADGDARVVPVALRTVADAVGGMAELALRTGLSRETLYRTLSDKGNPRLDTLSAILRSFGLRLAVAPVAETRAAHDSEHISMTGALRRSARLEAEIGA
jgi:probable addiction module antidote protein